MSRSMPWRRMGERGSTGFVVTLGPSISRGIAVRWRWISAINAPKQIAVVRDDCPAEEGYSGNPKSNAPSTR